MPEVQSVKGVIIACKGLGHWQVWVDTNEIVEIHNTEFSVGDWLQIDKMVSNDGKLLVSVAKIPPLLKTVVDGGVVDLETVIIPLKEYLYTREAKEKNHVLATSLHVGNVCITAPNRLEHNRAYLVTVRSLIAGNNPLELYLSKEYNAMWFVSRLVSRTPLSPEQMERLQSNFANGVVIPTSGMEKLANCEEVGPVTNQHQGPQPTKPLPSVTSPTLATGARAVVATGPRTPGIRLKVVKRDGESLCSGVPPSTKKPSLVNPGQGQVAGGSDVEMRPMSPVKGFAANDCTSQSRAAASRPASNVSFSSACTSQNHNGMDVDRPPLASVIDVDAAVFKRPVPNGIVVPINGKQRSVDRDESGLVTNRRHQPQSDSPLQPVPAQTHTLGTEARAFCATGRCTPGFGVEFVNRFGKSPSSGVSPSTKKPFIANADQRQVAGGSDVEMCTIPPTNGVATNESAHQLRAAASSTVSTASFSSVGRTPNHNGMDVDLSPLAGTTERRTSGFGLKFRQKRLEESPSGGVLPSSMKASLVNPDQGKVAGGSDVGMRQISTTNGFATNQATHQLRAATPGPVPTVSFSSADVAHNHNGMNVDQAPLASVNDDAAAVFSRPKTPATRDRMTPNNNDMDVDRPPLASVINDDAAVFKRPKTPVKLQSAPAANAIATKRPTSAVDNEPVHQGLVVSETEKSFFLYSPDFINQKEPYCMKARNAHVKRGEFVTFKASGGHDDRIRAQNLRKVTPMFVVETVSKTVQATVELHVPEDYNLTERFVGTEFMPHIYDAKSLIVQEHKGRRLRMRVKRGRFPKMPRATWGIVEVLEVL